VLENWDEISAVMCAIPYYGIDENTYYISRNDIMCKRKVEALCMDQELLILEGHVRNALNSIKVFFFVLKRALKIVCRTILIEKENATRKSRRKLESRSIR